MLDRSRGDSANEQSVQPQGSYHLSGVYIHCCPIAKIFRKGVFGWFRTDREVFSRLEKHPFRNYLAGRTPQGTNNSPKEQDRQRTLLKLFPMSQAARVNLQPSSSSSSHEPPPGLLGPPSRARSSTDIVSDAPEPERVRRMRAAHSAT